MKWVILSLFLSSLILTATAKGECQYPDVRLDKDPNPSPMKDLPFRNQGALGSCYAETGSQLVDAYRMSHGDKDKTHQTFPYAAAINSKDNRLKTWFRKQFISDNDPDTSFGGGVCEAVNGIKKFGSCDDDYMFEHVEEFNRLFGPRYSNVTHFRMNNFEQKLRYIYQRKEEILENINRNFQEIKAHPCAQKVTIGQSLLNRESVELLSDMMKVVEKALSKDSSYRFIQDVVNTSCEGHKKEISSSLRCVNGKRELAKRQGKNKPHGQNDTKMKLLNEKLSSRPVGISYCRNIISFSGDPSYEGYNFLGFQKKDCSAHASVVVGRRSKNGSCQLLIRDSYGGRCNDAVYAPELDCENGQVWVDEKSLKKNLEDIHYLEGAEYD